jgi:periplasmic protein CpxP/Spy
MSIFRGLTLVITNPTFVGFSSGRSQAAKWRYCHSLPRRKKGTTMSPSTHLLSMSTPFARSVAIAALMGATMLASPLTAARADTATNAAIQMAQAATPQNPAAAGATETKGETVEQRIKDLRAALKITPDQDSKWNEVARDMRENAAAMDKLIGANRTTPPQNMTAVEDLKMYQKFAQAHVDGLKNLISSFDKLYAAMPDAQKKIADQVFSSSRT